MHRQSWELGLLTTGADQHQGETLAGDSEGPQLARPRTWGHTGTGNVPQSAGQGRNESGELEQFVAS